MSFGSRLKQTRKSKNLTQKQLAEKLGVNNTTIANYENEVSSPKEDILLKIFDVLNVSPNFLFQDSFEQDSLTDTDKDILSIAEQTLIKKYHSLDESGKRTVDLIINDQYKRCDR